MFRKSLAVAALSLALPMMASAADKPQSCTADPSVEAALKAKGTPFTVDDDCDYRITVNVGNDRTQLLWVRSAVETTTHFRIREIWSPSYRSEQDSFSAEIANRLLEQSNSLKLGSWVKQGKIAMLVGKIDAGASADELDEAIDIVAVSADKMEQELHGGSDDL